MRILEDVIGPDLFGKDKFRQAGQQWIILKKLEYTVMNILYGQVFY